MLISTLVLHFWAEQSEIHRASLLVRFIYGRLVYDCSNFMTSISKSVPDKSFMDISVPCDLLQASSAQ